MRRESELVIRHPSRSVLSIVGAVWVLFSLFIASQQQAALTQIAWAGSAVVFLVVGALHARSHVRVTESGIVAQNPYVRHQIAWELLSALKLERKGFAIRGRAQLLDGNGVWLYGVYGGNGLSQRWVARAASQIREIEEVWPGRSLQSPNS